METQRVRKAVELNYAGYSPVPPETPGTRYSPQRLALYLTDTPYDLVSRA